MNELKIQNGCWQRPEHKICTQGIIQKKSASGCRTLPWLVIFFQNFILTWKFQKGSLNRGTLVSATAIYQTKCPFTVLSALFLFFWTLSYDSKLFSGTWRRGKNLTTAKAVLQCKILAYKYKMLCKTVRTLQH